MPSEGRDPDVALDDQYRRYKEKTETQEKVRIINEDFIDDIIQKRQKMGLGGDGAPGGLRGGRRALDPQQVDIDRARLQN